MLFVGWDVGGWNCDKNSTSRDALIVLDRGGVVQGIPWRGNLASVVLASSNIDEFKQAVFSKCKVENISGDCSIVLAIDAPLAFPEAFLRLQSRRVAVNLGQRSVENPYLYRFTERRLSLEGHTPLSAVKDMIGSQATKAMHLIACVFENDAGIGVWEAADGSFALETYPALCRKRAPERFVEPPDLARAKPDIADAWVCAAVARIYAMNGSLLEHPVPEAPRSEGWIWAPRKA